MTLAEFNGLYVYKSDYDKFGTRLDIWEVIKPKNGLYIGDCESYCLTVQSLIPELRKADLYYCRIHGNGHCILYKDGYVLDCNCRNWMTIVEYADKYKMTSFQKYWKIAILYKRVVRKLYKLFQGK